MIIGDELLIVNHHKNQIALEQKMEEKRLIKAIHAAVFQRDIRNYTELKDFYRNINYKDLRNMSANKSQEIKEIFEWIVQNPEYDFNKLFDNYYSDKFGYTNNELYRFFKLYYMDIVYCSNKYNNNEFIVQYADFL